MFNRFFHIAIVIFFVSLLAIAIVFAYNKNKTTQQTNLLLTNADNLVKGIEIFNKNYGRYPTELEFADKNVMKEFFEDFPPIQFLGSKCSTNYIYKNPRPKAYTLSLCLPQDYGKYKSGTQVPYK